MFHLLLETDVLVLGICESSNLIRAVKEVLGGMRKKTTECEIFGLPLTENVVREVVREYEYSL